MRSSRSADEAIYTYIYIYAYIMIVVIMIIKCRYTYMIRIRIYIYIYQIMNYIYIYIHIVYMYHTRGWEIYDQLSDPRSTWDACRKSCRISVQPTIGDPFVSGCVGSTCLIYLVAGAMCPSWKIWVRQWEGLYITYEMEHKSHVPNHQPEILPSGCWTSLASWVNPLFSGAFLESTISKTSPWPRLRCGQHLRLMTRQGA